MLKVSLLVPKGKFVVQKGNVEFHSWKPHNDGQKASKKTNAYADHDQVLLLSPTHSKV